MTFLLNSIYNISVYNSIYYFSKWADSTDEELCALVREGTRDAEELLVVRYTRLVRAVARPYFLAGGDGEDLIQEGLLGLLKAISDYSPDKSASFKTFAELCIRSRIHSAIRSALRDKHKPLNNYVSFESPLLDSENDPSTHFAICHDQGDPEKLVIGKEKLRELTNSLEGFLSSFESEVLTLYLEGYSYADIGRKMKKAPKAVDNAVQRIRRKLSRQISNGAISFD